MKMPIVFTDLSKFFIKSSMHLVRDFHSSTTMSRKKSFLEKTISYFQQDVDFYTNNFKRIYEIESPTIWIDGLENFFNSIPLFTISAFWQNQILVYDPLSQNSYYGAPHNFYVNLSKVKEISEKTEGELKKIQKSIIPDSLLLSWLLALYVDAVELSDTTKFEFFVQFLQLKDNYYSLLI